MQFDFSPLDANLATDPSVAWPPLACPSNPCTRTFSWKPTLYTPFSNPSVFSFIARDLPTNEVF